MKQKSFIKFKTPPFYITSGIEKIESSIKVLCREQIAIEMLAKVEAYTQLYSAIFKEGKITRELERALVEKCLFTRPVESQGETFNEKIGIYKTLALLIELACYYRVMSTGFYENGELEQTAHYLIRAGEVHGMIYRLRFEPITASRVGRQKAKETEELLGQRYQILKTKTAKKKSKMANSIKADEYAKKIEFAKQEWIALPAWHIKPAGATAEKLIKEHGKKVPGKDKLARLISEWKKYKK